MPSPSKALEAAKLLIGSFPNAKPHDPDGYVKAIAATLAKYPMELVIECADPRTGIACTFHYQAPNVADVLDWCEERLRLYTLLVAWKPKPPELPPPILTEEENNYVRDGLQALAQWLRGIPDPLAAVLAKRREYLAEKRKAALTKPVAEEISG